MKPLPTKLPDFFTSGIPTSVKKKKADQPLYNVWRKIKRSCYGQTDPFYKDYTGNGLQMFADWEDYYVFERDILASLPERPVGHTLIRRNVARPFEPGNLAWARTGDVARIEAAAAELVRLEAEGGPNIGTRKLNPQKVREIRALYDNGEHSYTTLAKKYDVSRNNIALIIRGEHWRNVKPDRHHHDRG